MKSLSGGSYASSRNPTGAVAKANQNAVTQPPTVIIQATGGPVFNYMADCWIFDGVGIAAASGAGPTQKRIGLGKIDSDTSRFTGVAAASASAAAATIFSAATGANIMSPTGTSNVTGTIYYWVGNVEASFWNNSVPGTQMNVVGAYGIPIANYMKCFP